MIVYVLQLLNNKFFVGSTYDIYATLRQVFSTNAQKHPWLNNYKPLYVHKIVHNCDTSDEHRYLIKYIREYGVDNVRGSTFDACTYEQESLREIRKNEKLI